MNQLYILLGMVVPAIRYDSVTDSYIQCDVKCERRTTGGCGHCWFYGDRSECSRIACMGMERPDGENVYFKLLKNH